MHMAANMEFVFCGGAFEVGVIRVQVILCVCFIQHPINITAMHACVQVLKQSCMF